MDNLEQIRQRVLTDIDPLGGPESVKVQNHNEILQSLIRASGKYSGLPFVAKRQALGGVVPAGFFFWNGNSMGDTNDFTITISKLDGDLNDAGIVLLGLTAGQLIKFKDLSGRSVYLNFKSIATGLDSGSNPVYNIVVSGVSGNTNYTYLSSEEQVCVLTVSAAPATVVTTGAIQRFKNRQIPNSLPEWEAGDFGIGFTSEGSFLNPGIYVSGDPDEIGSWDSNDGTVISPL